MKNKPLSKSSGTTIESLRADGYKAIFVGIGNLFLFVFINFGYTV